MKGGELFEFISEKDHVSESDAAKFITQILEGVAHFHARNIVHLDLKVSTHNTDIIFFFEFISS